MRNTVQITCFTRVCYVTAFGFVGYIRLLLGIFVFLAGVCWAPVLGFGMPAPTAWSAVTGPEAQLQRRIF